MISAELLPQRLLFSINTLDTASALCVILIIAEANGVDMTHCILHLSWLVLVLCMYMDQNT